MNTFDDVKASANNAHLLPQVTCQCSPERIHNSITLHATPPSKQFPNNLTSNCFMARFCHTAMPWRLRKIGFARGDETFSISWLKMEKKSQIAVSAQWLKVCRRNRKNLHRNCYATNRLELHNEINFVQLRRWNVDRHAQLLRCCVLISRLQMIKLTKHFSVRLSFFPIPFPHGWGSLVLIK